MTYDNYFSCLTGVKDNFRMNKHYFVFCSVRARTTTLLLALECVFSLLVQMLIQDKVDF